MTDSPPTDVERLARSTFFGERVVFAGATCKLVGSLHTPPHAQSQPLPGVVLVHGLGGNKDEAFGLFLKAAGTLALNGVFALRIDMRGAGETGGSTLEIDLERNIEDVSSALDLLGRDDRIDRQRLGLLGLSMGGLACACLTGYRDDIAALVIWEAPFNLIDTMVKLFGPLAVSAVKTRGYMQAGLMQLGSAFFDVLDRIHPARLIASYRRPVLIVQGSEDQIVPAATAEHWRNSFKSTDAELVFLTGADHAFTKDSHAWQAINTTVDWFKEHL